MPSTAALIAWLFLRSTLAPHEPASLAVPNSSLPSSRSAYGWLETTAPQVISDSFDGAGLLIGQRARFGVHGTSGSDTTFRFDGIDATSTLRPGTAIVNPDVAGASSIDVTRMASDVRFGAPGAIVDWRPLEAGQRVGQFEGYIAPTSWAIEPSATGAQPVHALRSMSDGSFVLGGALGGGTSSAIVAAHWAKADQFGTANAVQPSASQLSLLGRLSMSSGPDRIAATLAIQHANRGEGLDDQSGTAQVDWSSARSATSVVRIFGAYQWMNLGMNFGTAAASSGAVVATIDSATDGSVFPQLFQPTGRERVLRTGASITDSTPIGRVKNSADVGVTFDRSGMDPVLAQYPAVAETVDGVSARLWRVDVPTTAPHWTASTLAGYVNDRVGGENLWVEAGARFERLSASNGGATSIAWSNFFPHAAFQARDAVSGFGVFGTYTRSGARLPSMALAYGDPNAPSARIYRWTTAVTGSAPDTSASTVGSLVMRIGPGGATTAIDPALRRPVNNTFVGGLLFEKTRVAMSVSAVVRKTTDDIRAVADGGAAYTTVTQADPGADFTDASDDQQLVAYNRTPASFGLDHYTLTNPGTVGDHSMYALDISLQVRASHARLGFSAAAIKAQGTADSRGYRSLENDPGLIGDAWMNPNASTNADLGRPYFDRGYVGKFVGEFTLPAAITLGVVARYQDGQPFSRLAIATGLNQGPETVMAYPNGQPTRFTYISTTDLRLQKRVGVAAKNVTLILDVFNIFNIGREVEEYVLTNPAFRTTTVIEPPRSLRVGARISF